MEKRPRAATGRDSDKYIVRFLPGLKARIEDAAKVSARSINAEINARLQASFDETETPQERILAIHLADAHEEIKRLKMEVAERGGAGRQQALDLGLAPLKEDIHQLREEMAAQSGFIKDLLVRGWMVGQNEQGTWVQKRIDMHSPLPNETPDAEVPQHLRKRAPQSQSVEYVNIDPNAQPPHKRVSRQRSMPYDIDASSEPPRKRPPKKG